MPPSRTKPKPVQLHRYVGAQVRELAKKRRLSLNKLSDFAGISRSYLGRLLVGTQSPTLAVLYRIADALSVNLRELLPRNRSLGESSGQGLSGK